MEGEKLDAADVMVALRAGQRPRYYKDDTVIEFNDSAFATAETVKGVLETPFVDVDHANGAMFLVWTGDHGSAPSPEDVINLLAEALHLHEQVASNDPDTYHTTASVHEGGDDWMAITVDGHEFRVIVRSDR